MPNDVLEAEFRELYMSLGAIDAGRTAIEYGLEPDQAAASWLQDNAWSADMALIGVVNCGPSALQEVVDALRKSLGRSTDA